MQTVFTLNSDINNVHATINRELVGVDKHFQRLSDRLSKCQQTFTQY